MPRSRRLTPQFSGRALSYVPWHSIHPVRCNCLLCGTLREPLITHLRNRNRLLHSDFPSLAPKALQQLHGRYLRTGPVAAKELCPLSFKLLYAGIHVGH